MTTEDNRIMRILDESANLEEEIQEDEASVRAMQAEIERKHKRLERLKKLYYQLVKEQYDQAVKGENEKIHTKL